MSVSPGDVVSTSVGVLHVQTVVMERSREDVSFAMSGVDGRGVVHSNIPIGEGMVPLAVDVSDAEALVWVTVRGLFMILIGVVFICGLRLVTMTFGCQWIL